MKAFGIISIILASLSVICETVCLAKREQSDLLLALCNLACAICLTIVA